MSGRSGALREHPALAAATLLRVAALLSGAALCCAAALFCGAALPTLGMLGGSAHAQPQSLPKVLLIDPGDADLAARIAGQTRDLPVLLESASSREPDFDQARAQALADQRGAAAVVWTAQTESGAIEVHVLDALRRSERTRLAQLQAQAGTGADPLARSALFETTALIVRSELTNLLEQESLAARAAAADAARADAAGGTTVGGRQNGTATTGEDPDARKRGDGDGDGDGDRTNGDDDRDSDDIDGADQAGDRDRLLAGFSARAGFRLARIDGEHFAYGPLLGVGYDVGYYAFGLQATTSWPPIELESEELTLELRRHSIALSAELLLYARGDLRLLAGIEGGALLYARRTEIVTGTLLRSPPRTPLSATFGVGLEAQWLPTPFLGLAFSAGLDLLTAPPEFALTRAGRNQVLHEISMYEPSVALSIVLRP
jgi:hypothetical protein